MIGEHRFGRRTEHAGQRSGACGYHRIRVDVCIGGGRRVSDRERWQRCDQRNDRDVACRSDGHVHGERDDQCESAGADHEYGNGESAEWRLHAGQHAAAVQRFG